MIDIITYLESLNINNTITNLIYIIIFFSIRIICIILIYIGTGLIFLYCFRKILKNLIKKMRS